jgi:hypothetical protein
MESHLLGGLLPNELARPVLDRLQTALNYLCDQPSGAVADRSNWALDSISIDNADGCCRTAKADARAKLPTTLPRQMQIALDDLTLASTPAELNACIRQLMGKMIEITRKHPKMEAARLEQVLMLVMRGMRLLTDLLLFESTLIPSSVQCTWIKWLDRWVAVWLERYWSVRATTLWTDHRCNLRGAVASARERDDATPAMNSILWSSSEGSMICKLQTGANTMIRDSSLSEIVIDPSSDRFRMMSRDVALGSHEAAGMFPFVNSDHRIRLGDRCSGIQPRKYSSEDQGPGSWKGDRGASQCIDATLADSNDTKLSPTLPAHAERVTGSDTNTAPIQVASSYPSVHGDALPMTRIPAASRSVETSEISSPDPNGVPHANVAALRMSSLAENRVKWLLDAVLEQHVKQVDEDAALPRNVNDPSVIWLKNLRPDQLRGLFALSSSSIFRSALVQRDDWDRSVSKLVCETLLSYEWVLARRCRAPKAATMQPAIGNVLESFSPAAVDDIVRCACRLVAHLESPACVDALLSLLRDSNVPRSVVWNAAKSLASRDLQQTHPPACELRLTNLTTFGQLAYIRSRFECEFMNGCSFERSIDLDANAVSERTPRATFWVDQVLPRLACLYREHASDASLRTVAAEMMILLFEQTPPIHISNQLLVQMLLEATHLSDRFLHVYFRRLHHDTEPRNALLCALRQICATKAPLTPSHFRLLRMLIREEGVGLLQELADDLITRTLWSMLSHSMQHLKSARNFLEAWCTAEQRSEACRQLAPDRTLAWKVGGYLRHYLAQAPGQRYEDASKLGTAVLPILLKCGVPVHVLLESMHVDAKQQAAHRDYWQQTTNRCLMLLVIVVMVRAHLASRVELCEYLPVTSVIESVATNEVCLLDTATDTIFVPVGLLQWALARAEDSITLDALYIMTEPQSMTTGPIDPALLSMLLDALPLLLVGRISQQVIQRLRQFFIKYIGPSCLAINQRSGYWATIRDAASEIELSAASGGATTPITEKRSLSEEHAIDGIATNSCNGERPTPITEKRSLSEEHAIDGIATNSCNGERQEPAPSPTWRKTARTSSDLIRNRTEYARVLGCFLGHWNRLLARQAGPGVSPERRFAAVSLLEVIPTEGWSFAQEWYPENQDMLLEVGAVAIGCLLDPYDRVRQAAFSLFLRIPSWVPVGPMVPVMIATGSAFIHSATRRRADTGALLLRAAVMVADTPFGSESDRLQVPPKGSTRAALLVDLMLLVLKQNTLAHGPLLLLRYLATDCMDRSSGRWKASIRPDLGTITRLCLGCVKMAHRCADALSTAGEDPRSTSAFDMLVSHGCLERPMMVTELSVVKEGISASEPFDTEFRRRSTLHAVFLTLKEVCYLVSVLAWVILSEFVPDDIIPVDAVRSGSLGHAEDLQREIRTVSDLLGLLCDLLADILVSYRHHGICGHAAACWNELCKRLMSSTHPFLQQLPNRYLNMVLQRIRQGNLYVLRRSAGMPLLIQGIVVATDAAVLDSMANTLLPLGRAWKHGEPIPSVHAMHVLRALLQDTNLTHRTASLVTASFSLALEGFEGTAPWMVRNAALLLLSACIQRILGAQSITSAEPDTTEQCFHEESDRQLAFGTEMQASAPAATAAADFANACNPFDLEPFWRDPLLLSTSSLSVDAFLSRYATIVPHVSRMLEEAAQRGADRHPAVFPLLILLSSLAPSASLGQLTDDDGEEAPWTETIGAVPSDRAVLWTGRRAVLEKLSNALESLSCSPDSFVRRKAALAWVRLAQTSRPCGSFAECWPESGLSAPASHGMLLRLRYLRACGLFPGKAVVAFQSRFQPLAFAKEFGAIPTIEALRLYRELGLPGGSHWLPFCTWALREASDGTTGTLLMAALALQCLCMSPQAVPGNDTRDTVLEEEVASVAIDDEVPREESHRLLAVLLALARSTPVPELVSTIMQLAQKLSPGTIPTEWSSLISDSLRAQASLYVQSSALQWIKRARGNNSEFFDAVWDLYRARSCGSAVLGDLALEALGSLVHGPSTVQRWLGALERVSEATTTGGGQGCSVAVERRHAAVRSLHKAFLDRTCWLDRCSLTMRGDFQERLHRLCLRFLRDDEELVRVEARAMVARYTGHTFLETCRNGALECYLASDLVRFLDEAGAAPRCHTNDFEFIEPVIPPDGSLPDEMSQTRPRDPDADSQGARDLDRNGQQKQRESFDAAWRLLFEPDKPNTAHSEPLFAEQLELYMAMLRKHPSACADRQSHFGAATSEDRSLFSKPTQSTSHLPCRSCSATLQASLSVQPMEALPKKAMQHDQETLLKSEAQSDSNKAQHTSRVPRDDAFRCTIREHLLRAVASERDIWSALSNAFEDMTIPKRCDEATIAEYSHVHAANLFQRLVLGQIQAMLSPDVFCQRYRVVARRFLGLTLSNDHQHDDRSISSNMDWAPALWWLCQGPCHDLLEGTAVIGRGCSSQNFCVSFQGEMQKAAPGSWQRMVWFLLPDLM